MLHYCSYVSYRKTENSNGDKHMNDDKDTVNYMDSINKASRKRRRKPSFCEQYGILVIGAAVLAVIVVAVVFGGKAVNAVKGKMAAAQCPISCLIFPYMICLLYFGANTI